VLPLRRVALPLPQDREFLASVARTSLRTKLQPEMADQLTEIVTDAVLTVRRDNEPIDLHMVGARTRRTPCYSAPPLPP
jgi:T-complex protein 1 subunit zeta